MHINESATLRPAPASTYTASHDSTSSPAVSKAVTQQEMLTVGTSCNTDPANTHEDLTVHIENHVVDHSSATARPWMRSVAFSVVAILIPTVAVGCSGMKTR